MAALKWSSLALTAALLSFIICSAAQPITEGDAAHTPPAQIDSEMGLKNDHVDCNCGAGCGYSGQYYCRPANCGGDPACGGGFTLSYNPYIPAPANAHA